MPTYQYVCTECGGQLEAVQKFTDDPLTEHEACGGRLRKVFSPVGIVFKGSGFYRTDSRNGSSKTGAAASSSSSDAGDAKDTPAKDSAAAASASGGDKSSAGSSSAGSSTASSAGASKSASGEKVA